MSATDNPYHVRLATVRSLLDIVATVLVIVASVGVLAITVRTWRQPSQANPAPDPNAPAPPPAPQSLDGSALIGDRAARVAIITYSDLQCPYCATFARTTWPSIKRDYVESGKVVAAFRHLPLPSHQFARSAALSAECARRQETFWDLHDLLFENQAGLTEETGRSLVSRLGLNESVFEKCLASQARESVDNDLRTATTLGIAATPTFLIGLVQQDRTVKIFHILQGAQPFGRFKTVLDELLSRNGNRLAWFTWW